MAQKHFKMANKAENQSFDVRENLDHGVNTPNKENQILREKAKKAKD